MGLKGIIVAKQRTKLELTRIEVQAGVAGLVEEPERSYHAARRVLEQDHFDNRFIFGDNLLALRALEGNASARNSSSPKGDAQRDELITKLESQLQQEVAQNAIYCIRWAVV